MENVQEKQRLNYLQVTIIGLGYFCINLSLCYYDPTIPVYLGKYTASPLIIGLLSTIGFLFSALLQPYMGALSDRMHSRFGKRRLFLLVGMPLSGLFFVLISYSNSLVTLIAFIICFNIAFSVYRVPSMSLMPDVTPQSLWSSANGIINVLGGIGALVAYIVCANLYDQNEHYPFFLIAACLVVSTTMILCFSGEKSSRLEEIASAETKEEKPGVIKSIAIILTENDKSALLLLLSVFFRFMGYNGFENFIGLFGIHVLKIKAGQATVLIGIMAIAFIIFALPSGILAEKIGRKKTVILGLALMFVSFFACGVVHSYYAIAGLGLIGGLGYALTNTNAFPMLIKMGGDKNVGVYTGLYYLFYSIAAVAAPTVFGWFIFMCGYGSIFFFSCGFLLIALITTLGVKRGEVEQASAQG